MRSMTSLCGLLLLSCTALQSALAQRSIAAERCELMVEGRVARLYESEDNTRLVELQLTSVALEKNPSSASGIRIPAPGERVYVVLSPDRERPQPPRSAGTNLPSVGSSIRALLQQGEAGTWAGEGEWFESLAGAGLDDASDRKFEVGASTVEVLGMSCEARLVGGRLGLEVKRVQESSPAEQAGFQPGDVVVAVNDRPLASAADLKAASKTGEPIELTVVDVNSGRLAKVTVRRLAEARTEQDSTPGEREAAGFSAAERIAATLGIAVEPTRVGLRKAVSVTKVTPAIARG